jgi:hypothetical protein
MSRAANEIHSIPSKSNLGFKSKLSYGDLNGLVSSLFFKLQQIGDCGEGKICH